MPSAAITVRTDRGEERLDLEEFEARVARGEIAPQCPVSFPAVTGERWVPAGSLEIFKQRYSPRRLHFSSAFRLGGFPKVTATFIVLNLLWYAVIELRPHGDAEDTLLYYGAKAGPLLFDLGQYWRLLTANFIHKEPLHIAVNLFVLFNFAGALENAFRPLDIVLLWTGADARLQSPDYFAQPGLGREGVLWLTEQGVKVIGIDAYTLDRPFAAMVADYRRSGDGRFIWPAHFAGLTREYCQIEKLTNLDRIGRPHGFWVSCLPVKIKAASAAWCRAVALVPEVGP